MIYLYLNFNPKVEYNSSWAFISYVILTLEASEHQNFCIFVHLLQNILSVINSPFSLTNDLFSSIEFFYQDRKQL